MVLNFGCEHVPKSTKGKGMKKFLMFVCGIMLFTCPLFATGIDSGATNADCDNATLGQYNGTANLEMDWQPNTINVRWYSDDTQLSLYLPTPPTKKGYTFEGWKVVKVPGGFTELEYIESSGTQWINTGYIPNLTDTIEVKFKTLNTLQSGYAYIYGARRYYKDNGFAVQCLQGFWLQYGDSDNNSLGSAQPNTEYTVIQQGPTYSVNGNSATSTGTTPNLSYPLFLFSVNTSGEPYSSVNRNLYAKLYKFKVTGADGTVKYNYVPAKRKSDNVVGMWDTVTQTFFTNAGSGNFIAGPVVQIE